MGRGKGGEWGTNKKICRKCFLCTRQNKTVFRKLVCNFSTRSAKTYLSRLIYVVYVQV